MTRARSFAWLGCLLLIAGCNDHDPRASHGGSNDAVIAFIEIPAGSNAKLEFDHQRGRIVQTERNGVPRKIPYLPYPANYGFIEGTMMAASDGGDGDALDVFVICSALPTGSELEVVPIGIIELLDQGERDDKVIAIPADPALRTLDIMELDQAPGVRTIMEQWLLNYDPAEAVSIVEVKDAAGAREAVRRWRIERDAN